MKYRFDNAGADNDMFNYDAIVLLTDDGEDDYNASLPIDLQDEFGFSELMEGVYEYGDKTNDEVRNILSKLGYKEQL